MNAELRYDSTRGYYFRLKGARYEEMVIPAVFVNKYKSKGYIECQTLDLIKLNQRIIDTHNEVLLMSDTIIQHLLDDIRGEVSTLFKICEAIAMLDMLASFAQVVTTQARDYMRPEHTEALVIQSGRHPVKEKVMYTLEQCMRTS